MNTHQTREILRAGKHAVSCHFDGYRTFITPTGNGVITIDIVFDCDGGDSSLEDTVENVIINEGQWETISLYASRPPMDNVFEHANWTGDPVTLGHMVNFVHLVDPRNGPTSMLNWEGLHKL